MSKTGRRIRISACGSASFCCRSWYWFRSGSASKCKFGFRHSIKNNADPHNTSRKRSIVSYLSFRWSLHILRHTLRSRSCRLDIRPPGPPGRLSGRRPPPRPCRKCPRPPQPCWRAQGPGAQPSQASLPECRPLPPPRGPACRHWSVCCCWPDAQGWGESQEGVVRGEVSS